MNRLLLFALSGTFLLNVEQEKFYTSALCLGFYSPPPSPTANSKRDAAAAVVLCVHGSWNQSEAASLLSAVILVK